MEKLFVWSPKLAISCGTIAEGVRKSVESGRCLLREEPESGFVLVFDPANPFRSGAVGILSPEDLGVVDEADRRIFEAGFLRGQLFRQITEAISRGNTVPQEDIAYGKVMEFFAWDRDTCKTLLGSRFPERLAPARRYLEATIEEMDSAHSGLRNAALKGWEKRSDSVNVTLTMLSQCSFLYADTARKYPDPVSAAYFAGRADSQRMVKCLMFHLFARYYQHIDAALFIPVDPKKDLWLTGGCTGDDAGRPAS